MLLVAVDRAYAQTVELTPFGGYRFGGDLFESAAGTSLDTDGAPAVGLLLDIFLTPDRSVTFLYSHQEARVDDEFAPADGSGGPRIAVDHWQLGGTQSYGRGAVLPFVTGGLGATWFSGDADSELRFSMSGGGGVKLMPARHVGVRLEGRIYAVFVDGESRGSICTSGNCLIGLSVSVAWQAEFTAGVVLAF